MIVKTGTWGSENAISQGTQEEFLRWRVPEEFFAWTVCQDGWQKAVISELIAAGLKEKADGERYR